jgi:TRAP-type mannitol/chloroaromatic compound transport system substrate-binding protein
MGSRVLRVVWSSLILAALALVGACGKSSTTETSAGQAVAEPSHKKVQLEMASAFPTSLTLIDEAAPKLAEKVKRLSAATLTIKVYEIL